MSDRFLQISLAALALSFLKTDSGRNTESPETGLRASRRAFRTERSHKDQGKRTLDS